MSGQFRKSEATDPETFIAAWAAVMAEFPPCVLDYVCHPTTGLAIQSNWVPSVFEVREACITRFSHLIAKWRLEAIPPEKRIGVSPSFKIDEPREIRKTKDELLAKYGPNFGLGGDDDTRPPSNYVMPSLGEIVAHYTANKTLGIPLKRPMEGYDNGQDHEEGVLADTVTAGSEGGLAERQDAAAEAGGGIAPQGARCVGTEANLDEEAPPEREEGDPGFASAE